MVVAVRGSVVDVRFDGRLPPIYSGLRAGSDRQLGIEVLVERTRTWFHRARGFLVRWEKKADHSLAFVHLTCAFVSLDAFFLAG